MSIPVLIKTRNRPQLLSITLRSLSHTAKDLRIKVIDDGSDDAHALRFHYTDTTFQLPAMQWPDDPAFRAACPPLPAEDTLTGLKGRVEVIFHRRLGVTGAHFGYAREAFRLFPDDPWVLLLEDDIAMVEGWQEWLEKVIPTLPSDIGFFSLYDRNHGECPVRKKILAQASQAAGGYPPPVVVSMRGPKPPTQPKVDWSEEEDKARGWRITTWRGPFDNYGLAGGPAYLVHKRCIQLVSAFHCEYRQDAIGGDYALQEALLGEGIRCAVASPTWCQHLGCNSTARPGFMLRYSKNLAGKPVI